MVSNEFSKVNSDLANLFKKDLYFLCGVIKSGTTWLERILDSHPQLVCKGEAHFGSDLYQQITSAIDAYNEEMPRKGRVVAHRHESGNQAEKISYTSVDVDYLTITSVGLMMAKWLTAEPDQKLIKCVGDKTPSNLADIPLLSRLFPEAKFIHIIRDGRDVAVSAWNFNMNTDIGSTIRRWGSFKKYVPWFAKAWSEQIKYSHDLGSKLGGNYLEVRYEDLLTKPEDEALRLFQYLNVDVNADIIRHCLNESSFENMSGGRKQGDENNDSFYRKGIAGDWMNHFDSELALAFEEQAGPTLKKYGYSLEY